MTGSSIRNSSIAGRMRFCDASRKMMLTGLSAILLAGCTSARKESAPSQTVDVYSLRGEAARSQIPEPVYQLALFHYGQNEPNEAIEALHETLSRDSGYEPALHLLATLFRETGRVEEGLQYFGQRGVDTWPESVRLQIAFLHTDAGQGEEARAILVNLQQGVQADEARAMLAHLDIVEEERVLAEAEVGETIRQNLDDPAALDALALEHLQRGDIQGSVRVLQRLVARHPDYAPAQLQLSFLVRNYLFDAQGVPRSQADLDELAAPRLSEALQQFMNAQQVENTAPPLPELPAEQDAERDRNGTKTP